MRMAAHAGRTVEEFGASMSSPEFSEWMAFDNAYGFPDIYFMTGLLCAAVAGPWTKTPPSPDDFIPFFRADRGAQSPGDVMGVLRGMAERGVAGAE